MEANAAPSGDYSPEQSAFSGGMELSSVSSATTQFSGFNKMI